MRRFLAAIGILLSSAALAADSSKIQSYAVLQSVAEDTSKINSYVVMSRLGPDISKINSYAVMNFLAAGINVDPTNAASNIGCTGTVTSCTTGTFTAASSGELLVFVAMCGQNGLTSATVTSVTDSGPGLTWTKRSERIQTNDYMSVWYAKAPGAFSATVTANYTGCAPANAVVAVFGVTAYNTATPWDGNVSLPAIQGGTTANPPVGPISTTNTYTMLISVVNGISNVTPPTGWTHVPGAGFLANLGGCCLSEGQIDYQIVSSPQSALTSTYTNAAVPNGWITIGDAIAAAGVPAGGGNKFLLFRSGAGW